jgi:DNA invertase Pin-like site-specific DNA recombinase
MTREEILALAKRAAAGDPEALGRLQGKGGRPREEVDLARAEALHAQGFPWDEVARQIGISPRTLRERRHGR